MGRLLRANGRALSFGRSRVTVPGFGDRWTNVQWTTPGTFFTCMLRPSVNLEVLVSG